MRDPERDLADCLGAGVSFLMLPPLNGSCPNLSIKRETSWDFVVRAPRPHRRAFASDEDYGSEAGGRLRGAT